MPFPAGPLRWIGRRGRLDDGTGLVASRFEDLLKQRIGHPIRVVRGVHDEEVDRPDETAGADRWSKGEDRSPDHVTSRLGDEDARLWQVDQLAQEIRGIHGTRSSGRGGGDPAETNESIDVRYPGRSDLIFHAGGCNLARWWPPGA